MKLTKLHKCKMTGCDKRTRREYCYGCNNRLAYWDKIAQKKPRHVMERREQLTKWQARMDVVITNMDVVHLRAARRRT